MVLDVSESFPEIRDAVRRLCAQFPGEYWRALDRDRTYPKEFVQALTQAGFLSVLIPEAYGGSGLGLAAATAVLEEIHRSGCNGGGCHAQMYTMGTILRHGSQAQKEAYLPKIATGELRLQAFGVTEPTAGTDTTRISTFARREGQVFPFIPLIIVPSVFLSGLLINVERLPGWAQVIGHGFPLFYANAVIQEVIRPEGTLGAIWGHFAVLLGYSAVLLALASRTLAETE